MSTAPTTIRVTKDRKDFIFIAQDGLEFTLPAEMLRVLSPSAEVQGHASKQRKTVAGKKDVEIETIKMIGNYAIRIVFSDGHATGIYTWAYLRELGLRRQELWSTYIEELQALGMSR